jgi:hypothetical protein
MRRFWRMNDANVLANSSYRTSLYMGCNLQLTDVLHKFAGCMTIVGSLYHKEFHHCAVVRHRDSFLYFIACKKLEISIVHSVELKFCLVINSLYSDFPIFESRMLILTRVMAFRSHHQVSLLSNHLTNAHGMIPKPGKLLC